MARREQLKLGKKRDGEQRNLPGTRNVLSRYAGGGRGPWPSPRCRRDYGVATGIPPSQLRRIHQA